MSGFKRKRPAAVRGPQGPRGPRPGDGRKKKRPAAFLDRDGTIIHDRPGHYLRRPEKLRLYSRSAQALRLLRRAGFRIVVVSNQSGIGRGYIDYPTLNRIHARFHRVLREGGAKVDAIYFCPHHPDEGCRCRKPSPLLGRRAVREMGLSLDGAVMIGDKKADIDFGKALGIRTALLRCGHGRDQLARHGKRLRPDHVARDLLAAARWAARELRRG